MSTAAHRPATEPQLALRDGRVHIPRLTPTRALTPPPTPAWRLASTGKGDLANLALVRDCPAAALGPGQIRIQVRAAGLNFHDVVVALGVSLMRARRGSRRGGHRHRPRCDLAAPG